MKELVLLLFSLPCLAQSLQDAPLAKGAEQVKFGASAAIFTTTAAYMIYAQHDGARQCQAEDNRAGVGRLFDTADGYGHRPRDYRVYGGAGAVLITGAVLEFTGHKKAAKRILLFSSAALAGIAGATQWAGCN